MITQQQIDDLAINKDIRKFGAFVLSYCEEGKLPDYNKMDLMKIARIVPNVYVLDYRDLGANGLQFKFSGTKVDELWGMNAQGKAFDNIYKGENYIPLIEEGFKKIKDEKFIFYSNRYELFDVENNEYKHVENLAFPCSSDGEEVNFVIGFLWYDFLKDKDENVYLHL